MNKLDFGEVFNEAFELYKKSFGPLVVGFLVLFIALLVVYLACFTFLFGMGFSEYFGIATDDPTYLTNITQGLGFQLRSALFGLVVAILITPAVGGFLAMCKATKNGQAPSSNIMFQYYKAPYFGQIALATLFITLTSSLFSIFLRTIGLPILVYIPTILITTFTFLVVPLIVFKNMSATEAIKGSIDYVGKNFLVTAGLIVVGFICASLGAIACGIGILFTFPFYFAIQYTVYAHLTGDDDHNEIDAIGTE